MKITKTARFLLTIFFLSLWYIPAFATWSIIVINPKTKEIGIAGASCTLSVYGIGLIVPGKGAIVVQAMSNPLARLQGFQMIMEGVTPEVIMAKIREPSFDPEQQQYALLCLSNVEHPITYTGTKTVNYAGSLTGVGISVQGNMLANSEVVQAALEAALKAQREDLPMQEVLMLALEAGAKAGGDKRCGERKASSSFLLVSKPEDVDRYWLNLAVNENEGYPQAVDALRQKLNKWKDIGKP